LIAQRNTIKNHLEKNRRLGMDLPPVLFYSV
jgi:hypothetical protein